ncbi:MAG: hypothetical protein ACRD0H_08325 [Actinomycetes bacterium]
MAKQASEVAGRHHLPHSQQERCAVEGRRIDGSGPCTVIAIRDRTQHGWVLYPHSHTGFGVLLVYDAAHALADRLGGRS